MYCSKAVQRNPMTYTVMYLIHIFLPCQQKVQLTRFYKFQEV